VRAVTPVSTGTPPSVFTDMQHQQARQPERPRRPRGRWIWAVCGAATIIVVGLAIGHTLTRAGTNGSGAITVRPSTHAFAITTPVTSVSVESYGSDIRVTGGATSHVEVTETIFYDPQQEPEPVVTDAVYGGRLTLASPACATENCSIGFTITVPSRVSVTAMSSSGNVVISGVAGASVDSGGGSVIATSVTGPLTVASEGGNQSLVNLSGPLKTDSGGGDVNVQGLTGASATISTDQGQLTAMGMNVGVATLSSGGGDVDVQGLKGASATISTDSGQLTAMGMDVGAATLSTGGGDARTGFSKQPGSVDLTTDGGNATVVVPGGPYALTADSGGGPETVGIATSPSARSTLTVTTNGGAVFIEP
jgi:hypothetical protein